MAPPKIFRYLAVYVLWLIVLALGIWLILISRSALLGLAVKYYVDEKFMRQTLVIFLDKSYFFVMGLCWLVLMIFSEEFFRRGARKGGLLARFAIIGGIQFLLIFLFDLIIFFLQNGTLDPVRLLIMIIEITLGIGLILMWRNRHRIHIL